MKRTDFARIYSINEFWVASVAAMSKFKRAAEAAASLGRQRRVLSRARDALRAGDAALARAYVDSWAAERRMWAHFTGLAGA
jgi:hypothetical protein